MWNCAKRFPLLPLGRQSLIRVLLHYCRRGSTGWIQLSRQWLRQMDLKALQTMQERSEISRIFWFWYIENVYAFLNVPKDLKCMQQRLPASGLAAGWHNLFNYRADYNSQPSGIG